MNSSLLDSVLPPGVNPSHPDPFIRTVQVWHKALERAVRINRADYDAAKHDLYDPADGSHGPVG